MKIAILGGGFNPPHLGHLLICQQVLSFTENREIWLIPYFAHPWEKSAISPLHRFKMTKMMENGKIKVSDLEIKLKRKNYTYETVEMLKQNYPHHNFSWIIGSDLYQEFFTWERADEMVKKIRILVFPRAGWPLGKLPDRFYTISDKLLTTSDIASEKIREMVKKGLSIKQLVLPEVEKYILKYHLYK